MFIEDDGIRLNAKLDLPREMKNGKCPLVLVFHGFTGNIEEAHIVGVSRAMNEAGFATLRVDLYGHGESGGEFKNHTLFKWMTNMMTAVEYARSLEFATDLFLCGHSQGGLAVILTAALERDVLKGIIPMSPAVMIPEQARKGELLGYSFDPEHIPDIMESWDGRFLKGNYLRAAQSIHVEEAIDLFKGPVLIVHGEQDETVPFRYGEEAAARYAQGTLVGIPEDDHCYNLHLDQVEKAITEWLLKLYQREDD